MHVERTVGIQQVIHLACASHCKLGYEIALRYKCHKSAPRAVVIFKSGFFLMHLNIWSQIIE